MKSKLRRVWKFLIAGALLTGLAAGLPADAQQSPPKGTGLKVAPTTYEEEIPFAQPRDGVVRVFNISPEPLTIQPSIANARMTGDDGNLEFYIGDNPYKLHSFVQFDQAPFTLGVNEGRDVKFRVTIPAGIYPGGYFGALFMSIVPPPVSGDQTSVAQTGRVGTLLLLNVPGDVDQRGRIDSVSLTKNDFSEEKTFSIIYQNTGNTDQKPLGVYYKPVGTLTIKNLLGLSVKRTKLTGETVFPGAQRRFDAKISKAFYFGRYTAEISLSPGQGKPAETARVSFWAISPLAAVVVSVLALLALWLLIRWLRRRSRRQPPPQQSSTLPDHSAAAPEPAEPPDDPEKQSPPASS